MSEAIQEAIQELKGPSQPSTAVSFSVPRGACDCLTHIYGTFDRFPMSPTRTYTPELASIPEIESLHKALTVDRVILIQPTLYGTDNRCTLDAIAKMGARARGIAVVDEDISAHELDSLAGGGMRGIRINLETLGQGDPAVARSRLEKSLRIAAARSYWHVEMYARLAVVESLADLLEDSPVPVVLDHFAGIKLLPNQPAPGLDRLLDLLATGNIYIKLSAPYLAFPRSSDFSALRPIAGKLIDTNPQRILWGSNWPHPNSARLSGQKNTDITPLRQVDDGQMLNLLAEWAPDASVRKAILVDSPVRLFGF